MTKAEKLSEKISEIYFLDEFLDNFIYLTNPSRGKHVSKNKLIASYHNGTFGQLLSKYDSISFHCMEL